MQFRLLYRIPTLLYFTSARKFHSKAFLAPALQSGTFTSMSSKSPSTNEVATILALNKKYDFVNVDKSGPQYTLEHAKLFKRFLTTAGKEYTNLQEKDEILHAYDKVLNGGSIHNKVHKYSIKYAGIDCFCMTNSSRPKNVLIFFHGFGADHSNFFDVGDMYFSSFPNKEVLIIFPNGPMSLGGSSRAWWMIDFQQLQNAFQSGKPEQIVNIHPDGIASCRQQIYDLLFQVTKVYAVPLNNISFGGFSQGAMLSIDVFFSLDVAPRTLILLSPGPQMQDIYHDLMKSFSKEKWDKIKSTQIYYSHGQSDAIIPYVGTLFIKMLFESCKVPIQLNTFAGGHTVPPENLFGAIQLFYQNCI